ncbi:hypothetical protein [Halpernia frigidisoli]|uniref:Lipoprotein n=1 Tax=Halpernia frigidisoli TaxID=1125876 RepID=A0A1I3FZ67_9FLAO|nr:hypothetical protein [Halpernia frigidisoli]SFI16499.1 hypothetical protein SAMN05443292_1729 [Halpernia frigidisoli]
MKNRLLIFCLLFLLSCGKLTSHEHTFYYWRTNLSLNKAEKTALNNSKVPFLYTRFFDIDKIEGKFQPVGVLTKDDSFKTNKKIVPVVFIKNEILYDIKPDEIDFLAKSIFNLIIRKGKQLQLNLSDEIQIDCDWNSGTNKEYFDLLKSLKQISHKNITCTLRLHQVKDRNFMGIPPVEKVYLMCYATSSPLENSLKNSILDVTTLKNYLDHLMVYPLKMDIALPIYSWGIVTNHLGKHKLINALSSEELKKNNNFKKISDDNFEVLKDGFYFGNYLSKGFKIKIEAVSQKDLDETLSFINGQITFYNIIYYQLDSRFIKNYNLK